MKTMPYIILLLATICLGCKPLESNKGNKNHNMDLIKYKPEATQEDAIDWVTFTAPNQILIERTYLSGDQSDCLTVLSLSNSRGNAWSADDVLKALQQEGVEKLLSSTLDKVRLVNTLDQEGEKDSFIFICGDREITILSPNELDTAVPKADKDIAGLVYVLAKVYKQQVELEECENLRMP